MIRVDDYRIVAEAVSYPDSIEKIDDEETKGVPLIQFKRDVGGFILVLRFFMVLGKGKEREWVRRDPLAATVKGARLELKTMFKKAK